MRLLLGSQVKGHQVAMDAGGMVILVKEWRLCRHPVCWLLQYQKSVVATLYWLGAVAMQQPDTLAIQH